MSIKNKKKVVCHVPTGNQFENIKPIEVKCFLDENQITIEKPNDKQQTDGTATMMTIVPQPKRQTSAPIKKRTVTPITNMVVPKPIRHIAILPSSDKPITKEVLKQSTNLSDTFTLYEGPRTTPNVGRSLDETLAINLELPINLEFNTDDNNNNNNTTMSSACELVDQSKLQQKPHSLIGRYQLPQNETSTKPATVHLATVHYGDTQLPEPVNKQVLIQQFYSQLEKMKATFNTEQSTLAPQMTTNTLTFDNGQVQQTTNTKQIQEKSCARRISSAATPLQNNPKPPIPKKQKITKILPSRIQSAPVKMTTQINQSKISTPISTCKQNRTKKIPVPQKTEKSMDEIDSKRINNIEIHGSEVTLLPHEEQECRQMYEKLQRLQPNGVCVDMNTLRRALYPPVGTITYSGNINNIQTPSAFKSYRQRTDEMPQSWVKVDDKYVSQYMPTQQIKTEMNPNEPNQKLSSDNTDIDRIVEQVKKHAAINYSYYTRTK